MTLAPSMRCLRALVAVADQGSVIKAAEILNLSQPAVSRAIRDLEAALDITLFERHHGGMLCTEIGQQVTHRFRRALDQFTQAEIQLPQLQPAGDFHRLAQRLSYRHITVIMAVAETHNELRAARRLKLTQPTVSASLRDAESKLKTPLFLRTQKGMVSTVCGMTLIRYAKIALREISLMHDDIAYWRGENTGRVIIGALPLTSSLLVPQAVNALLDEMPGLNVTVLEGTYDTLFESLRNGEIDILVGVLRRIDHEPDMVQQLLLHDRLYAVARPDHPLAKRNDLRLHDLLKWSWIAPPQGTPARLSFDQQFNTFGLTPPTAKIEAGNLGVIRSLLLRSDRLALMSPYQVHYEVDSGQLCLLPIRLPGPPRAIGFTLREDSAPTQGMLTLQRALVRISRELVAHLPL